MFIFNPEASYSEIEWVEFISSIDKLASVEIMHFIIIVKEDLKLLSILLASVNY